MLRHDFRVIYMKYYQQSSTWPSLICCCLVIIPNDHNTGRCKTVGHNGRIFTHFNKLSKTFKVKTNHFTKFSFFSFQILISSSSGWWLNANHEKFAKQMQNERKHFMNGINAFCL